MPAPTMTPEQRAAALEKARVVRAKRSEITNKLAMGLTTPAEVLDQIDDPIIGRMKVKAFVNALPGFGKVKTEKLMEELGIPAERRLQGLGSNQMAALKAALSFLKSNETRGSPTGTCPCLVFAYTKDGRNCRHLRACFAKEPACPLSM